MSQLIEDNTQKLIVSLQSTLSDPTQNENDVQRLLEANTELIPIPFLLNHHLHKNAVISKLPISTSLITDFAYLTKSSDEWWIVFVELESQHKKIFNRNETHFRNRLSRNVPFGIKLVNLDNTVIENECMRSSPPGLCGIRSNDVNVIRVPRDFRTISAAVAAAEKGDTILVQNGVYRERVVIPLHKSAIRIIADGDRVILDGNRRLGAAFVIRGANNVEINGIVIRNYVNAGIRATSIDSKF